MRRALTLGAVAVVLVTVGVVLLTRGGEKARPGVAVPRTDDPKNLLTIAHTSQFDLARGASVRVTFKGGDDAKVTARLLSPSDDARLTLAGSGAETMLKLSGAQRSAARSCTTRWLVVSATASSGATARRVVRLPAEPPACGRWFAANSVWNTPLADDAKLDPQSSVWAKSLQSQVASAYDRNFPPTLNTTKFSTPIYTVPADQRRAKVELVGKRKVYGGLIQDVLDSVPIPDDAAPSIGTDSHIVVWQPATDTMWELWVAKRSGGRWTAAWGGRMTDVQRSAGYFYDSSGIQPGATATSLPLAGGLVTLEDLRRGRIDHALGIAIPQSRTGVWAKPAQRTDGFVNSDSAIPAGARFRLDPKLDIAAMKLPRLTKMLALAAQRYGIYVRDTSPTPTLYGEDPRPSGSNAWSGFLAPSPGEVLRAFPWDHLQVVKADLFTYSNKRVAR